MARARRTPAQVIGAVIGAAMGARGVTASQLAEMTNTHRNTVYSDLREPDGMPLWRMQLYFIALEIPIDETLQAFADAFSRSLIIR